MTQPEWECVAQIGDANPLDYGGYWVFRDKTGVYSAEVELLVCPEDEDGQYTAYRYSIEPCTYIDGVLSENKFHPERPAWFATPEARRVERPQDTTYLKNIADGYGEPPNEFLQELIDSFCGDDLVLRAMAYHLVGEYHGFENLDDDPLLMTQAEVLERYATEKYKVVEPAA